MLNAFQSRLVKYDGRVSDVPLTRTIGVAVYRLLVDESMECHHNKVHQIHSWGKNYQHIEGG